MQKSAPDKLEDATPLENDSLQDSEGHFERSARRAKSIFQKAVKSMSGVKELNSQFFSSMGGFLTDINQITNEKAAEFRDNLVKYLEP